MVTHDTDTNLATNDAAIKLAILRLAAPGKVKQVDCVSHIANEVINLDLKQGISPSLSPKRIGLEERITNCCEELFAANLIISINELEFSISALGEKMLATNPTEIDGHLLATLPNHTRGQREVAGAKLTTAVCLSHYDEGFAAYRSGDAYTDNPYPSDRAEHLAWHNGWAEALDHEQEHGPLYNTSKN